MCIKRAFQWSTSLPTGKEITLNSTNVITKKYYNVLYSTFEINTYIKICYIVYNITLHISLLLIVLFKSKFVVKVFSTLGSLPLLCISQSILSKSTATYFTSKPLEFPKLFTKDELYSFTSLCFLFWLIDSMWVDSCNNIFCFDQRD